MLRKVAVQSCASDLTVKGIQVGVIVALQFVKPFWFTAPVSPRFLIQGDSGGKVNALVGDSIDILRKKKYMYTCLILQLI